MANRILSDIKLFKADRSAEISLPGSETFKKVMASEFRVQKSLGKPWGARFTLQASSQLATASPSDLYYLTKKKIIRLVFDDASIEEWRITSIGREFSGEQNYQINLEPIWQDLAYFGLRKTLTTGDVRTNVSFYGQTVDDILTAVLSADYNCPTLFTKGTIDATIGAMTPRISLQGASIIDALKNIADLTDAEWDVTYDAINNDYEVNFYQKNMLGGGSGQATDRPIHMGSGRGNRKNMLMRSIEEDFFSRVIPIAGQGNDTIGIGDIEFKVTGLAGTFLQISGVPDLILEDDFPITSGETLYVGNSSIGWKEVTATNATTQRITTDTALLGLGATATVRFGLGTSKKKLTYLESAQAVTDIGIVEQTYRRSDIAYADNIIKTQNKSDDFSTWVSGMPTGWQKVGTPTVAEETGDQFVKFGNKSAKVTATTGEGISTGLTIDFPTVNPYLSIISYIYVESGSIKLEFTDNAGNLIPEGQFAESNSPALRGLALQAGQPASGIGILRIVALETGTVFYVDAAVATNSASLIQFVPLMGVYDLWQQSGRELINNGGLQGNEYAGTVWDDSYFPNDGSLREIDIGTWVEFKDGYNGSTFEFSESLRVIECSYIEGWKYGRVQKNVTLSNRPVDLNQFLGSTYVTQSSVQEGTETQIVNGLTAIQKAIRDGALNITEEGDIVLKDGVITNVDLDFQLSKSGLFFNTVDFTKNYSIKWGDKIIIYGLDIASSQYLVLESGDAINLSVERPGAPASVDTPIQILGGDFIGLTESEIRIQNLIKLGSKVDLSSLPTSAPAASGRAWNDSGTLKIS